ncbi:DUF1499 domain-containing protein [Pseudodesulfovibrio sediminis]|nr:DUF1499 domain-containing protein [Pseudodesulfovibrio sediminis]
MKYIFLLVLVCLGTLCILVLNSRRPPENLGVNNGRLALCPKSRNCVSSQADNELSYIKPLAMTGDANEVMNRLRTIIEKMDGAVVIESTEGTYLRAEFTSSFWKFKDDLECLYDEGEGRVDVRSASRIGYYDFNVNRNRLERLRAMIAGSDG